MFNKYVLKPVWERVEPLSKKNKAKAKLRQANRLLIVTQFYPPDYAATGQLISELAAQLGDMKMKVHIFTGQPGYAFQSDSAPKRETIDRISVRRTRTAKIWSRRIRGRFVNGLIFCLRAALHILKSANRQDILLLTTEPPYLPILGYFVHLFFGIPYVCLLYDLYPDVAVELQVVSPQHWVARIWDWFNCRVWRKAQRIIVLSSSMKQRVINKCPEVQDKVDVIHSWADPTWIRPLNKQENWFARQFDMVDTFTVLYSGNIGRCHDMDTILAAAEQLQQEPIQFVFIGDGAKRQSCLEKVRHLELTNCRFLPYQEKSVLPYSLTACDLSLVSIDSGIEGLIAPSKLYGILAAGRPVAAICSANSYLRQLLEDARCGKAFENGDGTALAQFIRQLAQNTQLVNSLGNAGRRYLQLNFTPEIIARQYWTVFQQVKVQD